MSSKVSLEIPDRCEVVVRKIDDYERICSFCGKHRAEVKKIVSGSKSSICDKCIVLCYDILVDEELIPNRKNSKIPEQNKEE